MMNKRKGRPTVLNDLVLQKLWFAFSIGCSDREACIYANIAPSTLYNIQTKNRDFLEQKSILKNKLTLLARMNVMSEISKNPQFALKFLIKKGVL